MKEHVIRNWRYVQFILAIAILVFTPTYAKAEVCSLGDINLEIAPSTLQFMPEPGECRIDGTSQVGYLNLASTGKEEITVFSIDEVPDAKSTGVFIARDENKHAAVALSTSDRYEIGFRPLKYGEYHAVLSYTYGYGHSILFSLKHCIQRKFGEELARRQKLVDEMAAVGPNFKMIEMRIERANTEHSDDVTKVNNEKSSLSSKLSDIDHELERALDEMRDGEFCSDCGGTRTEFEKAHKDFDAHIRDGASGGRHKRGATDAEIDKKIQEYQEKKKPIFREMNNLQYKYAAAEQKYDRSLANIELQRKALIQAFNERLNALRNKVIFAKQEFDEAMAEHDKLVQERRTKTSQVMGVCRGKK